MSAWYSYDKSQVLLTPANLPADLDSKFPPELKRLDVNTLARALETIDAPSFQTESLKLVQVRRYKHSKDAIFKEYAAAKEQRNVPALLPFFHLDKFSNVYSSLADLAERPIESVAGDDAVTIARHQELLDMLQIPKPQPKARPSSLTAERRSKINTDAGHRTIFAQCQQLIDSERVASEREHKLALENMTRHYALEMERVREEYQRAVETLAREERELQELREQERINNGVNSNIPDNVAVYERLKLSREMVTRYPGSYLSAKFSGIFKDRKTDDDAYYVNRDVDVLRDVLRWFVKTRSSAPEKPIESLTAFLKASGAQYSDAELWHIAEFYIAPRC